LAAEDSVVNVGYFPVTDRVERLDILEAELLVPTKTAL
jgi:hypothetical protein